VPDGKPVCLAISSPYRGVSGLTLKAMSTIEVWIVNLGFLGIQEIYIA
jgi:hypothetical protein